MERNSNRRPNQRANEEIHITNKINKTYIYTYKNIFLKYSNISIYTYSTILYTRFTKHHKTIENKLLSKTQTKTHTLLQYI